MKQLSAYLRLIRPLNLLMMGLTQLLFWFYIVDPLYGFFALEPTLDTWQVLSIITTTILVAAGGYVINDYYDLPIDLVNKPDKVVISKDVGDNAAFNSYMVLTATGLAIAFAVAWSLGKPTLVLLPFIIASSLWFYAQQFKRAFLVGNLVVSFCTAAVIFILLLFEVDWQLNSVQMQPATNEILKFGSGYMIFAFMMTMLREIVKDLQDMDGDAEFDCRTLPVVWGAGAGKAAALFWLVLVLFAVGWLDLELFRAGNYKALAYITVLIILPGIHTFYKIVVASGTKDYKSISRWIKIIMIFGILTMIYIGIILGKHG